MGLLGELFSAKSRPKSRLSNRYMDSHPNVCAVLYLSFVNSREVRISGVLLPLYI